MGLVVVPLVGLVVVVAVVVVVDVFRRSGGRTTWRPSPLVSPPPTIRRGCCVLGFADERTASGHPGLATGKSDFLHGAVDGGRGKGWKRGQNSLDTKADWGWKTKRNQVQTKRYASETVQEGPQQGGVKKEKIGKQKRRGPLGLKGQPHDPWR